MAKNRRRWRPTREKKLNRPRPWVAGTQKQVVKMSVCESDNESVIYTCECCRQEVEENDYAGCCRDGNCPHKIENLCTDCGNWQSEMWWCPKCVEGDDYENEADEDNLSDSDEESDDEHLGYCDQEGCCTTWDLDNQSECKLVEGENRYVCNQCYLKLVPKPEVK